MVGITKEKLSELREKYQKGTPIRLIRMGNDPNTGKPDPFPVPSGSIGCVDFVDDAGQIHMHWQSGSSLALIEGIDEFVVESEGTPKKWVQIWYSWGDQESSVEVPNGVDPWEYVKKLAVNEAATYFEDGHQADGEVGLLFYREEGRIILHYPCDDTYCYYLITDEEVYDPEMEDHHDL